MIVELLEEPLGEDNSKEEIGKEYSNLLFHYQQISSDNEAAESTVLNTWKFGEWSTLEGKQKIKKENEFVEINLFLGVLQLKKWKTDVLISWNRPVADCSSMNRELFETILKSFELKDEKLFG